MRRDIQLLRGIAVLFVVIYHAGFGITPHGYLGVDVFFVVSGFLITTIILKDLESDTFSFAGFYLRRAKRLLPALYCTLAFTSLLAYGFLTGGQWHDYIEQFVGAVSFSANMVLPTQSGYFAGSAEGKPLLHIWSLSLEEQYYFFLPLFLFLLPRKWQLSGLLLLLAGSLAWCISWTLEPAKAPPFLWRFGEASVAEWAFYLFPTRAWELLAGSVCAWFMLKNADINVNPALKWLALLTIIVASCITVDSIHPRGGAMLVVLATSVIILGQDNWLPKWSVINCIERLGDWSYSVYLVHWPLFAFAYLGYLAQVPLSVKIVLVMVSLLLGYAQYRFVETPFRYGWKSQSKSTWGWFAAATMAVFLIPAPAVFSNSDTSTTQLINFEAVRRTNNGLSEDCERYLSDIEIKPECVRGANPKLAIWGDSYAMHLVPGIAQKSDLIQLTKSVCGPFLDLAPIYGRYTKDWAQKCQQHNQQAFQSIVESKVITHVILSSSFVQYFKWTDGYFLMGDAVVKMDAAVAIESLAVTIDKLTEAGKKVILISPPPRSGHNLGDCNERKYKGVVVLRSSCDISMAEYQASDAEVIKSLLTLEQRTDVKIAWLSDLLCAEDTCKSKLDETYIYIDGGHLTISGSEKILRDFDWDK
ncbi:acyltransferase family protein [Neptunomonas antarctica]|uniref:Peptidoglycan/LPS O-acetylase OafA/YrhL, contains acyltransferase and SGNH-hydrolase domains n=1 Tax=Neptunomonas antarctica TaxID=619304 RepID=A0A1N7JEN8_9GAMM|nr:acyltransferase family protein [Neptunomonas antarctica]SIS47724.1 Peptidoglycan/LPS O-acetylase OafA/YrhL, contains acyltransferase and SGNH-hydrolase domains [Neptunomonas antarctica]